MEIHVFSTLAYENKEEKKGNPPNHYLDKQTYIARDTWMPSLENCTSNSLLTPQVAGGATLPSGAYCPVLDRLEAGMELVREAASQSGLTLGKDLSVIIDVGADGLFDQVY